MDSGASSQEDGEVRSDDEGEVGEGRSVDRRQLRRSCRSGTKRGVTRSSGTSEKDLSDRDTVPSKGPRERTERRTPKRCKARGSDKGRSPQGTPGGSPSSGPLDVDDPAIAAALES